MIHHTRTIQDRILLVIKGLVMGAANKVPGVSGGIVAIVAGFYEEFIGSLKKFDAKAFRHLKSFQFSKFFNHINGVFLGLLFLGMIISYFSVSRLLDLALLHYEIQVWGLFFGMILGSVYILLKDFGEWNRSTVAFAFLGLATGLTLSFIEPARGNDHLLFVFLCGVIGVTGMTLPGLSGSFLVLLLGNYVLLLVDSVNALFETITSLLRGDFESAFSSKQMYYLKIITSFSLGSLTGLISLSHLLHYLLKNFKNNTNAILIGFISGSLGVVWPWKETLYRLGFNQEILLNSGGKPIVSSYARYLPQIENSTTWWTILCIIVGAIVVIILEYYGHKKRK